MIIMILIKDLGIYAIAIAFSVAATFNALLLFIILHKHVEECEYKDTIRTAMQIAIATFVTFMVIYFVRNLLSNYIPLEFVLGVVAQLVITGIVGLLVYLFVTAVFGMKEFETIKKKIIIRIFARPQVANEEQNVVR